MNTILFTSPLHSGITVWSTSSNGDVVKTYTSMNQLVDEYESEIRKYLKQIDAQRLKAKLAEARALRGDLLRRLEAVDKDIAGMTHGSDFEIDK